MLCYTCYHALKLGRTSNDLSLTSSNCIPVQSRTVPGKIFLSQGLISNKKKETGVPNRVGCITSRRIPAKLKIIRTCEICLHDITRIPYMTYFVHTSLKKFKILFQSPMFDTILYPLVVLG